MKRFFTMIIALFMTLSFSLSLTACDNKANAVDELVVYNWADYIYDYEDDFKEYYKSITGKNIKVTYVTFDTNETMITKITKGDSRVDVMCPIEYDIQKLMQMDWLIPLNYFSDDVNDFIDTNSLLHKENYVHNSVNVENQIYETISSSFSDITCVSRKDGSEYSANMIDYMVPYMYGTLGILYNKEKFKELGIYDPEILNTANWGILFNDSGRGVDENGNKIPLSDGLKGSILLKDSIRDTYAATLFYLMESGKLDGMTAEDGREYSEMTANELINFVDDNILDLCKEVLVDLKSELFGYEVDFGKDDLLQGNAYVDLAWNGDAIYAVEESWNDELNDGEGDYELAYYVPHSYGNIWFDGWVIPQTYNPSHATAIKLFINFLNSPYVASQNIMEIGYTPAVSADSIKNDHDALAVLAEGYIVNAPEYYEFSEEELLEINDGEYDFESMDEFIEYFFNNSYDDGSSYDEIGNCNWRYPFEITEGEFDYKRELSDLGTMRDFQDKNKDVVVMWNYVRSAGVNAMPVFMITVGAIGATVGVISFICYIDRRKKLFKKVKKAS